MGAVVILLATGMFAQCKYKFNGIDRFTGDTVKASKRITMIFWMSWRGNVHLAKVNQNYFLNLDLNLGGTHSLLINQGDRLIFKLSSGKTVTLYALASGLTKFSSGGAEISTVKVDYQLSPDDVANLRTELIKEVRIYLAEDTEEFIISEGRAKKIQTAAVCL